jgi:hypothetical protein
VLPVRYELDELRWADSTLYKINNTEMRILLAGTIEFVHIEQVSTLFTFCLGQV